MGPSRHLISRQQAMFSAVVAKRQTRRLGHGPWGCHEILFSEPELFLSEPNRGAFCEQPAGRRAKCRGACSSHRPAAGTVACRRRRALAAPKDVSRRTVTSLTKSCFRGGVDFNVFTGVRNETKAVLSGPFGACGLGRGRRGRMHQKDQTKRPSFHFSPR